LGDVFKGMHSDQSMCSNDSDEEFSQILGYDPKKDLFTLIDGSGAPRSIKKSGLNKNANNKALLNDFLREQ
jgi:hypothetical protein